MKKIIGLLKSSLSVYKDTENRCNYDVVSGPVGSIRVICVGDNGSISSCALSDVLDIIKRASEFLDISFYIGCEDNKPFISIFKND